MKSLSTKLITFFGAVFLLLALSGCVHQELVLPSFGGGESVTQNSAADLQQSATETASVDVSDLQTQVQEEQIVPRIPFPVEEYSRLARTGSATVEGSIYLYDSTGRKIYGRQTRLYLNPVTSYSRQWYRESYLGGRKMDKADPRLFNYLKFTTSDQSGHFAFYGVPAGNYYLIGVVRCGSECGYDTPQNIRVAKEITVPAGGTVQVDLSKPIN